MPDASLNDGDHEIISYLLTSICKYERDALPWIYSTDDFSTAFVPLLPKSRWRRWCCSWWWLAVVFIIWVHRILKGCFFDVHNAPLTVGSYNRNVCVHGRFATAKNHQCRSVSPYSSPNVLQRVMMFRWWHGACSFQSAPQNFGNQLQSLSVRPALKIANIRRWFLTRNSDETESSKNGMLPGKMLNFCAAAASDTAFLI